MVLPTKVIHQFEAIPPNSDGNAYHGAWNKLLYTLFPADSDFTVVPNFQELGSTQGSDSRMAIDVSLGNRPVLLVDLKKPSNLHYVSKREDADMQIRRRMRDLVVDCPIPTLYGISAFGTALCFYTLNTALGSAIDPPFIPADLNYVTDIAPRDRWQDDVLGTGGEAKLRWVVEEIFQACSTL